VTADETLIEEPGEETEDLEKTAAEETAEAEEAVAAETPADTEKPGRRKLLSGKILPAALALFVVASLGLLGGVYWYSYRPDAATDAAAAKAAISAASEGTVAVLSYSPDTLDRDLSTAKSHLTGSFLTYYDQFTTQIVAPAAKQKSVKANAVVLRAALSDLHPDSADVLLFVNQSTQSKDRPEPSYTSSSISVTLTKAHGSWLISSFTPL